MHTAEEYFAALEACLKQMPAADRAQTITYYREYAQEGGLLDAEQLREHFGPPEALAARILEDEAGKYSQQDSPKSAGKKGVRLVPVLLGSFIAVVVAASALLAALHPQNTVEGPLPTDNAPAPQSTDTASLSDGKDADGNLPLHYDGEVDPFTEIAVDVVSAEIKVETGDGYGLRYTLCDNEIVDRAGVEGQTLYLTSHNKSNQSGSTGVGEVCITVPDDADLGELRFSTVCGGVDMPALSCDSLRVDNIAGNSVLDCVVTDNVTVDSISGTVRFGGQCGQLEVDATSGGLSFTGKADAVLLNTTSGDLDFTGTADTLAMDATSGSARIEGTVTEQVRVDMVSGNIFVTAADPTVTAEGNSIQYNGQRVGVDSWSRQGSGCTLILETSSGSVSIQNP